MSPRASARTLAPLAGLVLVFPAPLTFAQARLKQVAENQTWVATVGASSQYIEARGFDTSKRPLVVAGNFDGAVNFPVPGAGWFRSWNGTLNATGGVDSIFVGVLKQDDQCDPVPVLTATRYPAQNDYAISLTATAMAPPALRVPFDPDGDGDTDVAVVNHVASGTPLPGITVYYNDGAGDFSNSSFFSFDDFDSGLLIAAGDLNGDLDPDLVATTDGSNVKVFFNDGQGAFSFTAEYPVGHRSLALADLEGDGDLDLLTRGTSPVDGSAKLFTLVNRGNGIFDPGPEFALGATGRSITAADYDRDGDADLALDHGDPVRVLYNQGDGTFPTFSDFNAGPGNTVSVQSGDLTGDGHLDLLAAKGSRLYLVRNDGSGNFIQPEASPSGSITWSEPGDFDGDGDLDVAGSGSAAGGPRLTLIRNAGEGSLLGSEGINIGFVDINPNLVAGDFDSNGSDDLALVYVNGGSFPELHVLLNQPAPPPAGDCLEWTTGPGSQFFDRLQPVAWFSFGGAEPSSELRDMAVPSENRAYLTGVVDQTTFFSKADTSTLFLAPPFSIANGRGFLATVNDGEVTAATLTDLDLRPHAIAAEHNTERVVVFGQQREAGEADFEKMDALLQRYAIPATSTPADEIHWNSEHKFQNMDVKDVVVTSDDDIWVAGSVSGIVIEGTPATGPPIGGTADLWVGQADFPNTRVINDFLLGSEGFDEWGAMAPGPNGEIYVAFNVRGQDVEFGSLSYDLNNFFTGNHAFLGLIKSDGTPAWVVPLARLRSNGGAIYATDLDVDRAGNAYVSITANGTFSVRNSTISISGTGQMMVEGTGRVVSFTPTPNVGAVKASVVFDLENRFVLGRSSPPFVEGKASFSSIQSQGIDQQSYTVCWVNPASSDNTVFGLDRRITEVGGQVYLTSNYHFPPALPFKCVSAYLTPPQVATLNGPGQLILKVDPLTVTPDQGATDPIPFESMTNAGWALARLLDPFNLDDDAEAKFQFPAGFVTPDSTAKKVRVYVIDKGLAPGQQFPFRNFGANNALRSNFDGEGGLCVDALAHQTDNGELDPETASDHPKQAVNLVGVENLGAGQGTAMEFIGVDMYTGSSTDPDNCLTFLSYVTHGIFEAVSDASRRNIELLSTGFDPLPSLIVIASSGPAPETQLRIDEAVAQALANGIPVILSAGNDGAPAADYLPAGLGALDGVITVGGIAQGSTGNFNPFYLDTNTDPTGDIISLWAPGEGIPTGFGTSSGTSYSCALVAGIAATYLSMNPLATPAEVEEALINFSYRDEARGINLAQSTCSFAAWLFRHGLGDLLNNPDRGMAVDSDGDGYDNLGEFLGGSDPTNPLDVPILASAFELLPDRVAVSAWLPREVVGESGSLGDACMDIPFEVQLSEDLDNWIPLDPAFADLSAGIIRGSRQELRFEISRSSIPPDRAFFRFAFGQP